MRTVLYDKHKELNGKMIEFHGWELPSQYTKITDEHEAVRNKAGIFDVSHMGEVVVTGNQALELVDYLVTGNIVKLGKRSIAYTLMCNERGGVVDDLLVYKMNDKKLFLVINASNIDKDMKWIEEVAKGFDVEVENISADIAQIAIQGPKAQEVLQKVVCSDLDEIEFFKFGTVIVLGEKCVISRTGYTGEDGFEVYMPKDIAPLLWEKIFEESEGNLRAIGLGARDTLRFEAGLPLYGNELADEISPLEAGLGYFVHLDKERFIGRDSLVREKQVGSRRRLVRFQLEDKGIARSGYKVYVDDREIGVVTTGYKLPNYEGAIGQALVKDGVCEGIEVEVRGKKLKAKIIKGKFYEKRYRRKK